MEKMLVVAFEDEPKAYEGSRALMQLDAEGSITVHAEAVIKKNTDGTVTVKQSDDDLPVRTVGGTAIGSLIGLLAGPAGAAMGAAAGAIAGSFGDMYTAGVDADFIEEAAASLTPGKSAVVAEMSEEWVTPVDTRMEALGGAVFRTRKKDFEQEQRERQVAELRAEIAQLKTEHANARADRKAKIQAQIDKLNAKLQAKLEQAKQRSEEMKKETDAKVAALQNKAEKAESNAKAALNARIRETRESYEQSEAKVKHMLAEKLTSAAARLEK